MTYTIPQEQLDKLIKSLAENWPEASAGFAMQCTDWNYEKMEFRFLDTETDISTRVNMDKLREGMNILLPLLFSGAVDIGVSSAILDEGKWDAFGNDALIQCAIMGEVVYG